MSNKGTQIGNLLNTASASASDVTKPLKLIGDGNMLEGVKNIFNYGLKEGETKGQKYGFVKGSAITFVICGGLYLIPKGVKYIQTKLSERKAHNEMGDKIYSALEEEIISNTNGGDKIDEKTKELEA